VKKREVEESDRESDRKKERHIKKVVRVDGERDSQRAKQLGGYPQIMHSCDYHHTMH